MIFGKGECRRTRRTSNENLTKSAKMAAFWQGSFYSWLAYLRRRTAEQKKLFRRQSRLNNQVFLLYETYAIASSAIVTVTNVR